MSSRPCDSCNLSASAVFCRIHSAFLCLGCDSRIHGGGIVLHARVWICEVCEQAPATVTCRTDLAALCSACDSDVHSANPLARRHERIPVVPFQATPSSASRSFSQTLLPDYPVPSGKASREKDEAEAASWLLSDPIPRGSDTADVGAKECYISSDPYEHLDCHRLNDSVVPVVEANFLHRRQELPVSMPPSTELSAVELDFTLSKATHSSATAASLSRSVSSSSLDAGVVPDASNRATEDVSKPWDPKQKFPKKVSSAASGVDREARVLRYREKRKNRRFEKTIRYASRKAYAETRPRVKGRFAKRKDNGSVERVFSPALFADDGYGIVPSL